jgi:hypothetical protein
VVSLFFESSSPGQKSKKSSKSTIGKGCPGDGAGAALKRAFVAIDKEFLDLHGGRLPTTGSCGLLCYIEHGVLWSAIVGDSRSAHSIPWILKASAVPDLSISPCVCRAIIVRRKRCPRGLNLTEDQNTSNRSECAKVISRSGDPGMYWSMRFHS